MSDTASRLMFTQFRHAVETFAPQPRRSTDDSSPGEQQNPNARRTQSMDSNRPQSALTSAQLPDSALATLRKSFVPPRPESPASAPRRAREGHLSLEDRLRASFTIGEASTGTTPDASARVSPAPLPTTDHPLSPASIPLPQSPSPDTRGDAVQSFTSLPPIVESEPVSQDESTAETQPSSIVEEPVVRQAEAEASTAPSEFDSENTASEPRQELPQEPYTPSSANVDVESLQERLKLVEQRFSGVHIASLDSFTSLLIV